MSHSSDCGDLQWRDRAGFSPASSYCKRPFYSPVKRTFTRFAMKNELILMCHAVTHAMKSGRFPSAEDSIETGDEGRIGKLIDAIAPDRIATSAARAAVDTVRAAASWATQSCIDTVWNDMDYGAWSGRPIRDIHDADPDALAAWLTDPASSPTAGESLEALRTRVIGALSRRHDTGTTLVITHAIVVKVALAVVLGAPLGTVYSMDFDPLATLVLKHSSDGWRPRFRATIAA